MEGKEGDMPMIAPKVSWQMLRNYMEKFCWTDVRTGLRTTGYNPPKGARDVIRVPFHCTFVAGNGRTHTGNFICLKVNRRKHLRMVKSVESGETRWMRDYLVIEVDGTRVVTH